MIASVEKMGLDKADFVQDALQLYIDFVALFIRILVIIMKAKDKKAGSSSRVRTREVKIDL